MCLGFLFCVKF